MYINTAELIVTILGKRERPIQIKVPISFNRYASYYKTFDRKYMNSFKKCPMYVKWFHIRQ